MKKCKEPECKNFAFEDGRNERNYSYCLPHSCPRGACNKRGHGHPGQCEDAPRYDEIPAPTASAMVLPEDPAARKDVPMARGVLDYFPNALAAVAAVSKKGNDQHNPGQEMHWAREKSTDHADCILRHLVDRGTVDTDGAAHSAKVAWRALALLESELIEAGAKPGRNAK